jgi:osmotically-inducible protein OsmY
VSAPSQKAQAQKAAEATEGVVKVINNLQKNFG